MAVEKPTVAAVRVIITTALLDPAVQQFIDDATLIVTNCVASLSSDLQARIIAYVTAHLIANSTTAAGGVVVSDRLGDAARTYSVAHFGKQLASSSYGNTALLLDPNGCLARLGKARASIEKV